MTYNVFGGTLNRTLPTLSILRNGYNQGQYFSSYRVNIHTHMELLVAMSPASSRRRGIIINYAF